ncbi:MAG: hypothetical protein ACM3QZ_06950 [Solirubrobacterales bacterium]
MKRLPVDQVFSLMSYEDSRLHFDTEPVRKAFFKYMKDKLADTCAENSIAHYLAEATWRDVQERNALLARLTRYFNRYGWDLPPDPKYYMGKYTSLFR